MNSWVFYSILQGNLKQFKQSKIMMNQIISWSQGNPGAMNFLLSLTQPENSAFGIRIISKINELPIRGTDLYVLWSDLCGKDLAKVANLCDNCPDDVLVDAFQDKIIQA